VTKRKVHKAPITPFVWACVICLVFMFVFFVAVAVWLYSALTA